MSSKRTSYSRKEIVDIENEWRDLVRTFDDCQDMTFVNFSFAMRFVVDNAQPMGRLKVCFYHIPKEADRVAWINEIPLPLRKDCRAWWKEEGYDFCQPEDLWKTFVGLLPI